MCRKAAASSILLGDRDIKWGEESSCLSLRKMRPSGVLFFGGPWEPSVVISSAGKLCCGMFSVDNESHQMKPVLSLAFP